MNKSEAPTVQFQDVTVRVADGRSIVSRLNFVVNRGEILVLLGRSGSGKTTTLRLINRLLVPSEGTVTVDGTPTTEWEPTRLRRRIGYVIQEVGLLPHFTVERNVGIVPTLEGWDETRRRQRSRELLDLIGLDPATSAGRYPSELSGGQRQRVGVARALAANPPLLLLDEPFGALDPLTRVEMQNELKKLQDRLRKTMVFVTHDVREGLFLASRIVLFQQGTLEFIGTPAEFLHSDSPAAQAFIRALGETRWESNR